MSADDMINGTKGAVYVMNEGETTMRMVGKIVSISMAISSKLRPITTFADIETDRHQRFEVVGKSWNSQIQVVYCNDAGQSNIDTALEDGALLFVKYSPDRGFRDGQRKVLRGVGYVFGIGTKNPKRSYVVEDIAILGSGPIDFVYETEAERNTFVCGV